MRGKGWRVHQKGCHSLLGPNAPPASDVTSSRRGADWWHAARQASRSGTGQFLQGAHQNLHCNRRLV